MVVVLTTNATAPEPEREVLFSIDGIEYTIPKKFSANVALQYARVSLLRGPQDAVSWALEKALGETGYAALMAFDQLEAEDLDTITGVILQRIAAALEVPKGGLKAV